MDIDGLMARLLNVNRGIDMTRTVSWPNSLFQTEVLLHCRSHLTKFNPWLWQRKQSLKASLSSFNWIHRSYAAVINDFAPSNKSLKFR
jgi:hypothetical protein